MLVSIILVLWFLSGFISYVYWWTTEFDFELSTVPIALYSALIGPLAYIVGYAVHGKPSTSQSIVLFKKRKGN